MDAFDIMSLMQETLTGPAVLKLTLTKAAAFVLGLSPGGACAFYLQMVGFYTLNFRSEVFYVLMVVVLFVPYPVIGALQGVFDERFDLKFSTRTTYIFRTVFVQVLLGAVVALWMAVPQTPLTVLAVGLSLGMFTAVVSTSGLQMVAALDPKVLCFAQFGRESGGLLPLVMLAVAHFTPHSPLSLFRTVVASLFGLFAGSVLILALLNYKNLFNESYSTLAAPQMTNASVSGPTVSWILWWSASVCYAKTLTYCLLTSMPFLLNPITTQHLAMCQFASFLAGRLLVLPVQRLPSFLAAPWHRLLAALHLTRSALFALIMWDMASKQQRDVSILFYAGWILNMGLDAFSLSLVDVTTGVFIDAAHRKTVARRNTMSTFLGIPLGVFITLAIVIPSCHLHVAGIASDAAIPESGFTP